MPDPIIPASPVVVTPIQPAQSRTLRLSKWGTVWTVIVGFLPDLVEIVLNLFATDPKFAAAVSAWFPLPIRVVAMTAIIAFLEKYRRLRNDTGAPIAGTDRAEAALPLKDVPAPYLGK